MAHRQRDKRVTRVLRRLAQLRRPATAFEIGDAALESEPRAKRIARNGKEEIGIAIAVALARRGLLAAMPDNRFLLTHTWRTSQRDCNHPHTRSTRNVD